MIAGLQNLIEQLIFVDVGKGVPNVDWSAPSHSDYRFSVLQSEIADCRLACEKVAGFQSKPTSWNNELIGYLALLRAVNVGGTGKLRMRRRARRNIHEMDSRGQN